MILKVTLISISTTMMRVIMEGKRRATVDLILQGKKVDDPYESQETDQGLRGNEVCLLFSLLTSLLTVDPLKEVSLNLFHLDIPTNFDRFL